MPAPAARVPAAAYGPAGIGAGPAGHIRTPASAIVRDEVGLPVDPRLALDVPASGGRLERAHATVPAQDRVVVARRPQALGLGIAGERVVEERPDGAEGQLPAELRLRLPLVGEPGVERALVRVMETAEDPLRLGEAFRGRRTELVGEGEPEDAKRELLVRVHDEDIAADALRLGRLIQLAVAVGLLE